jgi:choline monooxygenase
MDEATTVAAREGVKKEHTRYIEKRPANFPTLPNLPAERYTDPKFFQLELDHFWPKTWLVAGHTGELPEKGSYKVWNNLGWPVVIVRGADDQIRAFHNVCRHRGGAFVACEKGKTRAFSCHFHGWTYSLEGALKAVPRPQDFPGLEKSEYGLLPLRCDTWGPLIFINRDLHAPALAEAMGPRVTSETVDYDWNERVVYHTSRYDVQTNWKFVYEAFRDVYHSYTVHSKTFGPALERGAIFMSLLKGGHARFIVAFRDDPNMRSTNPMFAGQLGDPRHALNRENLVVFTLFPNISCSFGEKEFAFFAMYPKGPLNTVVDVYFLTKPEKDGQIDTERCDRFVKEFPVVMDEDIENCRRSADGLNGGALNGFGFRMGYEDRLVHHWHENIDRTIGIERVPEHLRVAQLLHPLEE